MKYYHGTHCNNITSIKKLGLTSETQNIHDESREIEDEPIVVLRIAQSKLEDDIRYDGIGSKQGIINGSCYLVRKNIPPEDIEISTRKGWINIIDCDGG